MEPRGLEPLTPCLPKAAMADGGPIAVRHRAGPAGGREGASRLDAANTFAVYAHRYLLQRDLRPHTARIEQRNRASRHGRSTWNLVLPWVDRATAINCGTWPFCQSKIPGAQRSGRFGCPLTGEERQRRPQQQLSRRRPFSEFQACQQGAGAHPSEATQPPKNRSRREPRIWEVRGASCDRHQSSDNGQQPTDRHCPEAMLDIGGHELGSISAIDPAITRRRSMRGPPATRKKPNGRHS